MAIFNLSNQLIQVDQGNVRKYLFNKSQSPISVYAGIGESQVPGQRFASVSNTSVGNPWGAPTIYELVYYKSTANPAPQAGPAPVWWTDTTFTTVTGVQSESLSPNYPAGYLMLNTTDYSGLTAAMLNGTTANPSQVIIAVAGYVKGAIALTGTTAGTAVGSWVVSSATPGNWTADSVASGTAPGLTPFGRIASVVSGGFFDIVLNCDII